MNNTVERYIYDVVRRLPESERSDVESELKANIYDMLSDEPTEAEIESVLQKLGRPSVLAEEYRLHKRYLIAPAVFETYLQTLKLVLPIVGLVMFIVGLGIGIFNSAFVLNQTHQYAELFSSMFASAFGLALSGLFQAVVWITIGFAVYDYARSRDGKQQKPWTTQNLPELPVAKQKRISVSETIAEIIMTVFFTALLIMIWKGIIPAFFSVSMNNVTITALFTSGFADYAMPFIIIAAAVSLLECVIKLVVRSWSVVVFATVCSVNVVSVVLLAVLLNYPNYFTSEFIQVIQSLELGRFDFVGFLADGGQQTVAVVMIALMSIVSVVTILVAAYRTFWKGHTFRESIVTRFDD